MVDINSLKQSFFSEGVEGLTVPEAEYKWLSERVTPSNINQMWNDYFNSEGVPAGPLPQRYSNYLSSLGYTGTIMEKQIQWFQDEPAPSNPVILTAGEDSGGAWIGFSDGTVTVIGESFGSLSAELVDGFPVVALAVLESILIVVLGGDATGVVDGMTLWIDGVEYEPTYDWVYNGSVTVYTVDPSPFLFVDGNTYEVEIK